MKINVAMSLDKRLYFFLTEMTKVKLSETCGQESDLKQAIPANYNFIGSLLPKSFIYDSSVFVHLLESFLRGQDATQ